MATVLGCFYTDEEVFRIKKAYQRLYETVEALGLNKGIHSCFKCTSEPYHQGHVEAECEVCHGMFWLDEDDRPFNPDKEVRHGEILRSVAKAHTD